MKLGRIPWSSHALCPPGEGLPCHVIKSGLLTGQVLEETWLPFWALPRQVAWVVNTISPVGKISTGWLKRGYSAVSLVQCIASRAHLHILLRSHGERLTALWIRAAPSSPLSTPLYPPFNAVTISTNKVERLKQILMLLQRSFWVKESVEISYTCNQINTSILKCVLKEQYGACWKANCVLATNWIWCTEASVMIEQSCEIRLLAWPLRVNFNQPLETPMSSRFLLS